MSLADRLEGVRRRIARAAESAGRSPAAVRLLAVSKRQSSAQIREAYAAGQRDFGENYVQELLEKSAQLAELEDLRWHFIGHLQRNKVGKVLQAACCLHALDSTRLAEEVGRRASSVVESRRWLDSARLPVFVQVNLSGEEQRSGCEPGALGALVESVCAQSTLQLVGLMGIAPGRGDPDDSRRAFERLVRLRDAHGGRALLPELSLGMSRDLEVAVACGSSWVRVGTDIFGARR